MWSGPRLAGMRIRAPELVGRGGWINTGGKALTLADLRGKIVLLDFWTFCCINCLHVIEELRPLEEEFHDVLVTIGVHSPKFVHEADHEAVLAAVERYEVGHPVLDDPELTTWNAYAVRAWPTLAVVDPEGYVVAQMSGEGHAHGLRSLIARARRDARGQGHAAPRRRARTSRPSRSRRPLRFPAKAIRLDNGNVLVADAGHHSLAELGADGETLVRRIGSGEPGLVDGDAGTARFARAQRPLPAPVEVVATQVGYDVVVADTVNHALRGVRLADGARHDGRRHRRRSGCRPTGSPRARLADVPLSSPWDVTWSPDVHEVVVAMAGIHQLWSFDPIGPSLSVLAGTTNEGLRDGPPDESWLAQPCGLAVGRRSPLVRRLGDVLAAVTGERRRRHRTSAPGSSTSAWSTGRPTRRCSSTRSGVTLLPDGSVAVLDTYNGAVRRFDPVSRTVTTLAMDLREPSGALLDADGTLLVVESAAHRLTRIALPGKALQRRRASRPDAASAARRRRRRLRGHGRLRAAVRARSWTTAMASRPGCWCRRHRRSCWSRGPAAARLSTGRRSSRSDVPEGVLHVAAFAASCDEGGDVEFPACHVHQQDWGIPVRVTPAGATSLTLYLRG